MATIPPENEPIKVQLAFQGGGAKFVMLLAAAIAFKECEKLGLVKVTTVTGTSAGAIVAALFAANANLDEVLKSTGKKDVEKLAAYLQDVSLVSVPWSLVRGKALRQTKLLRDWLEPFFNHLTDKSLGAMPLPLSIITTDLGERIDIETASHLNVLNAVIDSSAIPIYFRMWSTGGGPCIVDGGLCDNLPVRRALERQEKHGKVVAITFERMSTSRPQNAKEFVFALVDAALGLGERLSREALEPHCVIAINTDITTFNFKKAFEFAQTRAFAEAQGFVTKKIENFVAVERRKSALLKVDPWRDSNPSARYLMEQMGTHFEAHQATRSIRYEKFRLTVIAHSLRRKGDPLWGIGDSLEFQLEIHTTEQPVSMISACLTGFEDGSLDRDTMRVATTSPDGQVLEQTLIPMRTKANPNDRDVAICFNPPLPAGSGPFRIVYSVSGDNLMASLVKNGKDVLMYWPRNPHGGVVNLVELCLYAPDNVHLTVTPEGPAAKWEHMEGELDPKQGLCLTRYARRTYALRAQANGDVSHLSVAGRIERLSDAG